MQQQVGKTPQVNWSIVPIYTQISMYVQVFWSQVSKR